jgi:4-amino-4-deoxy-L-arabinose transferase-like glycosyltransferase
LFLAFALRVPLLNGPRFHPDEALYASFARAIAVWRDPLLRTAPVDKPPLLFYTQALCYPFLGPGEMAARLPNLFGSLLTVALTYAVARRVLLSARQGNSSPRNSEQGAARTILFLSPLVAAVVAACSPLAVAFGATAFTDPLMVAWGMASVLAAAGRRAGPAGLWLGLALATKYQAIIFAPLVVGLLWLQSERPRPREWARMAAGLLLPLAAVAAWDVARSGWVSLLGAQVTSYGGVRLAHLAELWPRLVNWLSLARHLIGSVWISVLLLAAVLLGVYLVAGTRLSAACYLLGGSLAVFFLFHWLLTVKVWDRYLLPAVPVMAVLVGWSVGAVRRRLFPAGSVPRRQLALVAPAVAAILLALLLPGAVRASNGALPVGGDHGVYDGIEQVAGFFADHPYGTVLYDHWLNWQLRYYLFDTRVYVSWFPHPAGLAEDLQAFGASSPRYLLVPTWESRLPITEAVQAAGFELHSAHQAHRPDGSLSFIVYRITPAITSGSPRRK